MPTRTQIAQPQREVGSRTRLEPSHPTSPSHVPGSTGPHAALLHLQRTAGNQAISQVIQAKLREDQAGNGDTKGQAGLEHVRQSGHPLARIPISPFSNKRENHTGLPDAMKVGVETLSGLSMDAVRVHYNSSKPAQLEALAYTQGTDIHVGPGQEQHLAHEAWHVVQQKQGRVKPTLQAKEGAINDDQKLENEADTMSARANTEQRRAMQNARSDRSTSELTHVIQQTGGQVAGNKAQPELAQQSSLTLMGQHQRNVIQMRTINLNDGRVINTNKLTLSALQTLYLAIAASDPNGAQEILLAIIQKEYATSSPLAIGLSSGPTGNISTPIGGPSPQPPVSTNQPPTGSNKDYNRRILPLIGFMGYRFGQGLLLNSMGGKSIKGVATGVLSALFNSKALLKAPPLVKGATAAFLLASALTMAPLKPRQLLLETGKKVTERWEKWRGKE